MGRLSGLLEGWTPVILVALLVLTGLVAMALRPRGARRRGSDALDGFSDVDEDEGQETGPRAFTDFGDVLRRYVLPQRAAHPDWDRLDGAVEVPGQPLVSFDRGPTRYVINGATRFEPLLAAHAWMEAHPGEDPLEVAQGDKVGRLRLRRAIWPTPRDVRIETA